MRQPNWTVYSTGGKPTALTSYIEGLEVYCVEPASPGKWVALTQSLEHAVLFSAAPKMLAALEAALPWVKRDAHSKITDQIKAAIAAAKGDPS